MDREPLHFSLEAGLADLAGIRGQVREYALACQASAEQADEVELAVDEAAANVIRHAYGAKKPARLEITASCEGGNLVVVVRDYGKVYRPQKVTQAQLRKILAEHTPHGLGRYIMQMCMDDVTYRSRPGKHNETKMVKKLSTRGRS